MQHLTFDILYSIFSKARMQPYLKNNDDAKLVLSGYHDNIMLSEAMIPTLHYFEICLRNRIDYILKKHFSPTWLLHLPNHLMISEQDKKKIEDIISKTRRVNKREPHHDDVVAQMTFGFWCAFFHRKYDPVIWHRKDTIKTVFPNLLRHNRKRMYVEDKILILKEIRNRIAHHEPVWNRKISILDAHTVAHELIFAMSSEATSLLKTIDRFPSIYEKLTKKINQ